MYYAINKIQHYTFSLFYNNLHRLHSTFLHAKFSSEYYTSFILLIISILLTDRDSFTAPHQSIWIEMSLSFVARYYILITLKTIQVLFHCSNALSSHKSLIPFFYYSFSLLLSCHMLSFIFTIIICIIYVYPS